MTSGQSSGRDYREQWLLLQILDNQTIICGVSRVCYVMAFVDVCHCENLAWMGQVRNVFR